MLARCKSGVRREFQMSKAAQDRMELGTLFRAVELDRGSLSKDKRTVKVQFSSETPVQRWFGREVLEHSASAVDLSRMNAGAAVLLEHDTGQRIGITESATLTASKTGEAVVRFARTPAGDSAMAEVEDGTLRWLSVGYRVDKFDVDDDEEEYRAVRWQPLEVSFVAIPADPTARVLRNNEQTHTVMLTRSIHRHPENEGGGGAPAIIKAKEDFSRELDEVKEMYAMAMHYQRSHPAVIDLVDQSVKDKVGLVDFQRKLLEITRTPGRDVSQPAADPFANSNRSGYKTIGQRFVESDSYKRCVKDRRWKNNGLAIEIPDQYRFGVDTGMMLRATLNAGTEGISGTSGVNIDQQKNFHLLGQQALSVADLFASGATNSDIVRIIQESSFTNAATRVAEGANKPEATLDLGVANFTVEKTAVFLNVTEEMMSDWAQASSFVNGRLGYMVQALEDQQLLNGSGSSQIYGILNTTGIQTVPAGISTVDALLRAKAYVEGAAGAGFAVPDAYVMNPLDWLSVRLTKDGNGQYLFGGPGYSPYGVGGYANVGSIWGLPVLSTVSIAQGTALVGAFRTGAQIFRRSGLTIRQTDSHASNFIANILTIVAEQRLALAVFQPNKFCSITAIPASA